MAAPKDEKDKGIIEARHPVYQAECSLWQKWRLCYEGSDAFKEAYLYKYSKREDADDFIDRKKITYVPGHSRSVINIIRNALAVRLPDVKRTGSEDYLNAMDNDVDGFDSSMTTFVALDITPMLLVQGKRYVVIDAPPLEEGQTRAEDGGIPYLYTVDAEDVLSWAYNDDGGFSAILMRLAENVYDPETGLVVDSKTIYRYMRQLAEGETYKADCGTEFTGEGVVIATYNEEGKLRDDGEPPCQFLQVPSIPVVEFRLVASIMAEIADHQISLLNLASTDMDFTWRGNFPIYTQQQAKRTGTIRPRGTKRRTSDDVVDSEDPTSSADPGTGPSNQQRRVGTGKGIGYGEGLERPGFISPDSGNLTVSMAKQESIAKEIRVLVDLALVSLSVRAVEQSGKSKEADRIGEEAGLAYIGQALETGERELANLWHMMAGETAENINVKYPESYSIATPEERREAAAQLRKLHSAVRSAKYQHVIDQRIAVILLKGLASAEEIELIMKEIEENAFLDDDSERAEIVQKDVAVKILSRESGAMVRGYSPDEASKVRGEEAASVSAMLGGSEGGPGTDDGDGDGDGGDGGE
jgi:hypothetical protein